MVVQFSVAPERIPTAQLSAANAPAEEASKVHLICVQGPVPTIEDIIWRKPKSPMAALFEFSVAVQTVTIGREVNGSLCP